MKKYILLSFVILFGCAKSNNPNVELGTRVVNGMFACQKASNGLELTAVGVLTGTNPIAIKLAPAAINRSGSMSTSALLMYLSSPLRPSVFVYGEDADTVAATVETALTHLTINSDRLPQLLCISSDVKLSAVAHQKAEAAKIQLLTVQN